MQNQPPVLFHPGAADNRVRTAEERRNWQRLIGDMRRSSREFGRRQRTRYWRKQGRSGRALPGTAGSENEKAAKDEGEFTNILAKFNEFRQNDQFCDGMIVSADEKTYKVHRVLFASNSDYFRAMFGSPLSTNVTVVRLGFPSNVVDAIIEFCYTRLCIITEQNVQQLLVAADQIGMISLLKLCCKFLKEKLDISNAYGIYQFASVYGCGEVAEEAWNLILSRFVKFLEGSPEFTGIDFNDLRLLLSNSYLNIPSETVAFQAMRDWINADPARQVYANELWGCVRFGLIPPSYYRLEVLNVPFIQSVTSSNLWNALEAIKKGNESSGACNLRIPYQVVFTIGGWSEGAPTNWMETYDIRANRWFRSDPPDAFPRAYHGLVCVDNLLYMIGGFDGTNHFNSVRCFDPVRKIWSEKACMHRQRCYVSCVVVDKDIYAIGGFNSIARMNSVERYSIARNQWTFVPPMNKRRSDCGAVVVGSKIYVAGGFNGHEILNTAEYYDVEKETWYPLPSLNIRRSGLCMIHYGDNIYAIGGFDGNLRLNAVEKLPLSHPITWQMSVPSMITQRSNFCSVVLEEKIYVMGGYNGISTISDCECFDGEKWFQIDSMNRNRSALCVCVCEGLKNAAEYTSICLAH